MYLWGREAPNVLYTANLLSEPDYFVLLLKAIPTV
jgi:hypothetical protein